MIEYIIFNNKIESETISELMISLHKVDVLFDENPSNNNILVIYFTSSGGTISYADYLVDYLNRLVKKFKIEIVCSDFLLSSGLCVPLLFEGKVLINSCCHGMMHLPSCELNSSFFGKKNELGNFYMNDLLSTSKKEFSKYSTLFTKKEKEKYFNYEDVYFSTDRLQKYFNKRNLIYDK